MHQENPVQSGMVVQQPGEDLRAVAAAFGPKIADAQFLRDGPGGMVPFRGQRRRSALVNRINRMTC